MSSKVEYIRTKTFIPCHERGECPSEKFSYGCVCGKCFWNGITIAPELVPECSICREDTEMVKNIFKGNPRGKVEYEPKCFRACVWWEWSDRDRRNKIGCVCEGDSCSCGKLKYIKKEHTQVATHTQVQTQNIKKINEKINEKLAEKMKKMSVK